MLRRAGKAATQSHWRSHFPGGPPQLRGVKAEISLPYEFTVSDKNMYRITQILFRDYQHRTAKAMPGILY